MIETAEQLAESFQALPPSERKKFFRILGESPRRARYTEHTNGDLAGQIERHRRARLWIEKNKKQYDGQWVCLDGDTLIAHGTDGHAVHSEAKSKGIKVPFLERIKAEELPFGGW